MFQAGSVFQSKMKQDGGVLKSQKKLVDYANTKTFHSPLFSRKIVEIECYALRVPILDECQNYLGAGSSLGGSEKNRGTVITSLSLALRRRDMNFTPFTIH